MAVYNKEMLADMERGVTEFFSRFSDDAGKMSGWGHNYFCEKDGGKLIFDLDSPDKHACPICGCVYTTEKYCRTWTYLYRVQAIQEVLKAAYLFKATGEPRFLNYIKITLRFYAENYRLFELHVKDKLSDDLNLDTGGAARIMPQGLNESIALTKILLALDILGSALEPDFVDFLKDKLFCPAIDEVLAPQLNLVHNIKCWVNSAIGMAGVFFEESRWIKLAFEGEYNIGRQLREGVTDDCFWYEGSIHYNFFTLEAIISLLLFCKKYNYPFGDEKDIPRQMLLAAYSYAFDNGLFPNPNDGWPDVSLKTYFFLYKMAQEIYGDDELCVVIKAIEGLEIERMPVPLWDPYHFQGIPLESLFVDEPSKIAPPIAKGSILYPASNFVMLRQGAINLFVKYGHNGPSHAHPDKMTFELMFGSKIITRDISNAGYGAKLCNEWHRMSASHNTVVVDGKNHTNMERGEVIKFTDNEVAVRAHAYEGIIFERSFCIADNGEITDVFSVNGNGEREHTFDYFLHIDGDIAFDGCLTPSDLEFDGNGYQHLLNVNEAEGCREFRIKVHGAVYKILIESGKTFLCDTFDNPVTKHRKTLIIRQSGKDAIFKAVWEIGDGAKND